jgi:hypothetical protein
VLAAEWRWLKVTDGGVPVVPLRAEGAAPRRPYEILLLARSASLASSSSPPPPALPAGVTLLCAPGAHSRKPRLLRLLRPLAPGWRGDDEGDADDDVCDASDAPSALRVLELFARELSADATAWGNEPLRFQATAAFQDDAR